MRRFGSERGDNMRRCRSQGTRARLVRAFTTAGGGGGLTTTPEDPPCSPPPTPGGPHSAPSSGGSVGGGSVGGGGGSGSGSGGGSMAVARLEQRALSLLHTRHYTSFGSNVTYQ